jgi:hypothetical protein
MSQTHNRVLIIVILGALSTISPFAILIHCYGMGVQSSTRKSELSRT